MARLTVALLLCVGAAAVAVGWAAHGVAAANRTSCEPLAATSYCAGVLDHTDAVLVPPGTCQADVELNLVQDPTVGVPLPAACRAAWAKVRCTKFYRNCALPAVACHAQCTALESACGPQLTGLLQATGFYNASTDCTAPGDTACGSGPYKSEVTTPNPSCAAYPASGICAGYLDANYSVYTPAGSSQAQVEAIIQARSFVFAVAPQPQCRDLLARFMCTTAFPRCDYPLAPLGAPLSALPFPQLPCRSVCTDVVTACGPELAAQFGVNCTTTTPTARLCSGYDVTPPRDDYPVASTAWGQLSGQPISTACNVNSAAVGVAAPFACPYPTVVPDATDAVTINGGSCALPCPPFLYGETHYEREQLMMDIVNVLGLVCDIYMFGGFVLMPKKDREKKSKVLCFVIGILTINTCWFLRMIAYKAKGIGQMELQCASNSQVITQSDGGFCVFEAVLILFCSLGCCFWWCSQAVDLWLNVAWNAARWSDPQIRRKEIAFHCVSWGVPALMVVIALSAGVMGGSPVGTPWCFINSDNYLWGLFYLPIGVCFAVGTVCMGWIIRVICQTQAQAHALRKQSSIATGVSATTAPSNRADYSRPLAFILAFGCIWGMVFANRFYLYLKETEIEDGLSAWVACVLLQQPRGVACGGRPNTYPEFAQTTDFLLVACGVWTALLFGTTTEFYRLWYGCVCCVDPERHSSNSNPPATPRASGAKRNSARGSLKPGSPASNAAATMAAGTNGRGSAKLSLPAVGAAAAPGSPASGGGGGDAKPDAAVLAAGTHTGGSTGSGGGGSAHESHPSLSLSDKIAGVNESGGGGGGGASGGVSGGGGGSRSGDIQLATIGELHGGTNSSPALSAAPVVVSDQQPAHAPSTPELAAAVAGAAAMAAQLPPLSPVASDNGSNAGLVSPRSGDPSLPLLQQQSSVGSAGSSGEAGSLVSADEAQALPLSPLAGAAPQPVSAVADVQASPVIAAAVAADPAPFDASPALGVADAAPVEAAAPPIDLSGVTVAPTDAAPDAADASAAAVSDADAASQS